VLFEQLLETIKFEITRVLMLVSVKDENEAKKIDKKNQEAISAAQTEKSSTLAGTDKNTDKKVGRNEPCPCGSGKKYKHCHGILN
jgi:preprotein translocase subunit SecA